VAGKDRLGLALDKLVPLKADLKGQWVAGKIC
jgi:hypothetical protein